jgi:hypothetical protein
MRNTSQAAWDKYQLAKIAGANITSNMFIVVPAGLSHDPANIQSTDGAFSPKGPRTTILWFCSGVVSYS